MNVGHVSRTLETEVGVSWGGGGGDEVHFFHVKRLDFVLVVISQIAPNSYIFRRILTSRNNVTLCR